MDAPQHIENVDALGLSVPRTRIDPAQNAGGDPSVGSAALFTLGGSAMDAWEVGVWEMGVGAMYDVEVDEVFVVLEGEAMVEVLDASGLVAERTTLAPGVICRLHAGTRTRWSVQRTLRKVYIARADG